MQVGDLVKLIDAPHQRGPSRPASDFKRTGVLVECTFRMQRGDLIWVQWIGNSDWDCEYIEDLEGISDGQQ